MSPVELLFAVVIVCFAIALGIPVHSSINERRRFRAETARERRIVRAARRGR